MWSYSTVLLKILFLRRLEKWPMVWIPCGIAGNSKACLVFMKETWSINWRKMRKSLERLGTCLNHNGNRALTLKLMTQNRSKLSFHFLQNEWRIQKVRDSIRFVIMISESSNPHPLSCVSKKLEKIIDSHSDYFQCVPVQHQVEDKAGGSLCAVRLDQHHWCTEVRQHLVSEK